MQEQNNMSKVKNGSNSACIEGVEDFEGIEGKIAVSSASQSHRGNEITLYTDLGKYCISIADFKLLGYPTADKTEQYPFCIDRDEYEKIEFMAEKLRAVKYLSYLLSFSDKSEKMLMMKLKEKEYSANVSMAALEVMKKSGLVNEAEICGRKMQTYAREKCYGPFRIKRELVMKGFSESSINEAFEATDIDFDEVLRELCRRLVVKRRIDDKRKLCERLMRYGYSYSDIKGVIGEYIED